MRHPLRKSPLNDAEPSRSRIRTVLSLITPVFARNKLRLALGFTALIGVDFLQLIIPRFLKQLLTC